MKYINIQLRNQFILLLHSSKQLYMRQFTVNNFNSMSKLNLRFLDWKPKFNHLGRWASGALYFKASCFSHFSIINRFKKIMSLWSCCPKLLTSEYCYSKLSCCYGTKDKNATTKKKTWCKGCIFIITVNSSEFY